MTLLLALEHVPWEYMGVIYEEHPSRAVSGVFLLYHPENSVAITVPLWCLDSGFKHARTAAEMDFLLKLSTDSESLLLVYHPVFEAKMEALMPLVRSVRRDAQFRDMRQCLLSQLESA